MLPNIVPFDFGEESIHSGVFIQVYCTVKDGDLPLRIIWLHNGIPIKNFPDISTAPVGKRGSVLSIESVQYEHAGNYSCRADNVAGEAEFTAELQVNGCF